MRDLYIHIGLHKTGSTYLQHMILENRAALQAAGLGLAPFLHPLEGNHYPLFRALRAAEWRPEGCARVFEAVADAPGEKLLISAEELSWTMARPERAQVVLEAAARHFNPRLLIFLRRQDYLKESIFAQAVKTWYTGPIAEETHYDYGHDARLRALEALVGRVNVAVALFHDGGPNELTGALLAALGVAVDRAALRPVPRQNVSMHRRQVLFMSQLPKPALAGSERRHMDFARRIAASLQASAAVADDGERFLMSPRARHELVAAHLPGNRALVARYGLNDAAGFLELPDPEAPWTPPAPITGAERAAAFGAALRGALSRRHPVAGVARAARAAAAFARMRGTA